MDLTAAKIREARKGGADYLCAACPFCHIQFDTVQSRMLADRTTDEQLSSILYSQLLGLSMGIDEAALGLEMNPLDITGAKDFLLKHPATQETALDAA